MIDYKETIAQLSSHVDFDDEFADTISFSTMNAIQIHAKPAFKEYDLDEFGDLVDEHLEFEILTLDEPELDDQKKEGLQQLLQDSLAFTFKDKTQIALQIICNDAVLYQASAEREAVEA